jgi:hypothetical protein
MYTIANFGNGFVVKKNDKPISLEGIGLLLFKTYAEAEEYIVLVRTSQFYINAGIPE